MTWQCSIVKVILINDLINIKLKLSLVIKSLSLILCYNQQKMNNNRMYNYIWFHIDDICITCSRRCMELPFTKFQCQFYLPVFKLTYTCTKKHILEKIYWTNSNICSEPERVGMYVWMKTGMNMNNRDRGVSSGHSMLFLNCTLWWSMWYTFTYPKHIHTYTLLPWSMWFKWFEHMVTGQYNRVTKVNK